MPPGTLEQGSTLVNRVRINSTAENKGHTEAHEIGHFLLLGSPINPGSAAEHNSQGGIFTYKTVNELGDVIEDIQHMSQKNINRILENIPNKKMTATVTTPLAKTTDAAPKSVAPASISTIPPK